jgi:hypothetical protein
MIDAHMQKCFHVPSRWNMVCCAAILSLSFLGYLVTGQGAGGKIIQDPEVTALRSSLTEGRLRTCLRLAYVMLQRLKIFLQLIECGKKSVSRRVIHVPQTWWLIPTSLDNRITASYTRRMPLRRGLHNCRSSLMRDASAYDESRNRG